MFLRLILKSHDLLQVSKEPRVMFYFKLLEVGVVACGRNYIVL